MDYVITAYNFCVAHWDRILLAALITDRVVAATSNKYDDYVWGKIKGLVKIIKEVTYDKVKKG